MTVSTHYETLGVAEDVTPEELKKTYRAFMRAHHPDLHPGAENEALVSAASAAYSVLKDPEKRAAYDKSLIEPEPEVVVEEDWTPSWGEEESWGSEVFEDVVDSPIVDDVPQPTFDNEPTFGSEDSISKLPPPSIPENLKEGKVILKSELLPAMVAIFLQLLAPLVGFFGFKGDAPSSFLTVAAMGSIMLSFASINLVHKWKKSSSWRHSLRLDWWGSGVAMAVIFGVLYLIIQNIKVSYGSLVGVAFFAPLVVLTLLPTVLKYFDDRKLLKPKIVRKNNSFGEVSGTIAEELLEEALNPVWGLPGVRCFRMANGAFTHLLIFNNKVIALKPVYMQHRGVLKFSGPTLMNRFGEGLYQPLLGAEYIAALVGFTSNVGKKIKVYPMVVAFPGHNLMSFEKDDRTTIVAGDDVAALATQLFTEDEDKNIVDHPAIVSVLKAAYSSELV